MPITYHMVKLGAEGGGHFGGVGSLFALYLSTEAELGQYPHTRSVCEWVINRSCMRVLPQFGLGAKL